MFRKNQSIKTIEHINILFDNHGFGDYIALMTPVKYIKDNCPNVIPHLWVRDFFVDIAKNLVPGLIVKSFSKANKEYNAKLAGVRLDWPNHTSMGTHIVDFGFHVLVDKQVDIKYKNYCKLNTSKIDINKFNLPKKYVCLSTGYTAEVREMYPNVANEIISYCKAKGYEVVTLGSKVAKSGVGTDIKGTFKQEIKFEECTNLVDKTTPLEAGKIIAESACMIGLDNGLLHLAGTIDVPIVGGFSTVLPEHRMPYRHDQLGWNFYPVVPDENLDCRGCQSLMTHVYDHDFRFCYYGDKMCLDQLTSNKYVQQLEKLL